MEAERPPRKWYEIPALLAALSLCLSLELLRIAAVGLLFFGIAWLASLTFDVPLNAAILFSFAAWGSLALLWALYSTWRGIRCPQCRRRIMTQKPLLCGDCGGPARLAGKRR